MKTLEQVRNELARINWNMFNGKLIPQAIGWVEQALIRFGFDAAIKHLTESDVEELDFKDTGIWEIPIDDVDGDLISNLEIYLEEHASPRKVLVVEKEWTEKQHELYKARLVALREEIAQLRVELTELREKHK